MGYAAMRARSLFLSIILLLITLGPATACAQYARTDIQYSYPLDVGQMINCFGITSAERMILINTTPQIMLQNPLIIMGSGADMIEYNSVSAYTSMRVLDSSLITGDGITSYYDRPLSYYDLILIGGPEHNAMTKQLQEQGLLTCTGTDLKMPGLVIEVVPLPDGHKIVVIGDVSGYAYHKKDLPLNGILPETLAPSAAIALGTGLGVIGAMICATGTYGRFRRRARGFMSGYRNANTAEAASESYGDISQARLHGARKSLVFGFSIREIMTMLACCVLFSGIFLLADRLVLDREIVILYLVMGTIAVIVHDLGHRMVARKLEIDGEYRFWGLGTVTMLLTSWLFGMAFAQPARYVLNQESELEIRDMALVTLAGPAVSLLFAILFLPFALIGGVAGQIAV
ncbi:MAG: hypothetical protein WBZ29_09245, partial [Methanocella sp.]